MTHLTRVELRRIASRTLVLMTVVGAVLATVAVIFGAWQTAQPVSAAETAQAERAYQEALADWELHGEVAVAQCLEDEARETELQGERVDFACDQMEPQREWYVMQPPLLHEMMPGQLGQLGMLLLLAAFLVGATSTGAEISTGAIGNWLTFEPRRLLVYGSKVLAAGLAVLPPALLLLLVTAGGTWFVADRYGLADAMTAQHWADTGWTVLRVLALTGVTAAVGAALGFLLRHTAAVLGVAIGYAVVVEGMLGGLLRDAQQWLVLRNIEAWVAGSSVYYTDVCTTGPGGTVCEGVEHTLGAAQAAGYLAVLAVVLTLLAAVVFRRRDVA